MVKPIPLQPNRFIETLYEKLQAIASGIGELELYEFCYCLDNLTPEGGWECVQPEPVEKIEHLTNSRSFYESIQIKPQVEGQIVLDPQIAQLTRMLLVGLASGVYASEWIREHFYFDVRGFYFLHRTSYFTPEVLAHFGGNPYRQFEQKQKNFEKVDAIGYKHFKAANAEVDALFIDGVKHLIADCGKSTLLAIAGPTAAGKTEIVSRLREAFVQAGKSVTSVELDNFLTDREGREAKGIFTLGKEALHFKLFVQCLEDLCAGKNVTTPRYDFITATSSHNLDGMLKPGAQPVEIDPADIIFIEGNFPFLIQEVVHLIDLKVVYLTDDPIRMKRKWKRDIDYRKKYNPNYFRNRYFKEQFIMAEFAYRPQLLVCDLCVDTTGAALWTTPEIAGKLSVSQVASAQVEI